MNRRLLTTKCPMHQGNLSCSLFYIKGNPVVLIRMLPHTSWKPRKSRMSFGMALQHQEVGLYPFPGVWMGFRLLQAPESVSSHPLRLHQKSSVASAGLSGVLTPVRFLGISSPEPTHQAERGPASGRGHGRVPSPGLASGRDHGR